jgi:UDP-glucuronate decarboxylase
LEHPQKETYFGNVNIMGPRACYDESKRIGETLTNEYMKLGVETRIVRIFNTFGPRMNVGDGSVVSNFIVRGLKGKEMEIFGNGTQTRCFLYVHDLVDGILMTMEGAYKGPVNLGNPNEFTINDFDDTVMPFVYKHDKIVKVVYLDATEDYPKRRKPDITKAKEQLGWEPQFSVQQGLEETVEYFKGIILDGLY